MHQSSFCWSHLDYNTAVDAVDKMKRQINKSNFLKRRVRKINVGFLLHIFKAIFNSCSLKLKAVSGTHYVFVYYWTLRILSCTLRQAAEFPVLRPLEK